MAEHPGSGGTIHSTCVEQLEAKPRGKFRSCCALSGASRSIDSDHHEAFIPLRHVPWDADSSPEPLDALN